MDAAPDPNAPTVRQPSAEPTVLATPVTHPPGPGAAAPPERFGRYELRAQLGRGGMGTVYRAFDTQLKREVALKVLRMHAGDEAQQFLRFRREAEAAARLRHPNLVVTYDFGVEGDQHFLTMELVEGGTLARRLEAQGGRLPPHDAMRLARDVALGLACAHNSGIVHRDLKPENILLDGATPKISDFGLAHAVSQTGDARLTMHGSIVGTPAYMAPEQAAGKVDEVDARSDVYALGTVLYETACGRRPYPGKDPMAVIMAKVKEDPPRPRSVHPAIARDVETIIVKAMAREPARRYATAAELAADLDRCMAGEAILARPETALEAAWRLARRRRGLVAAAAIVALLLAVAGGAALSSRTEQKAALDNLRTITKTNLDASLEMRRAGVPLAKQERFLREVETAAREAMKRAPRLAEPHYRLGRVYRAQMRFDDALAEQERAVAKDATYAPARYERALLNLRRWEQRLADLRAAWLRDEGRRLAERGQLERAGEPPPDVELATRDPEASQLRDRIAADLAALPDGAEASCLRGLVERDAERIEDALRVDSTLEEGYEGLARAARSPTEAMRAYDRGLAVDKGYVPFWIGRAELAAAPEKAVEDLDRALALDPSSRAALRRRGEVLLRWADRLGDEGKDPEPTFERALADLTAASAWRLLGQLEDTWGYWMSDRARDPRERYARAVDHYGRAIAAEPLSSPAWWGRGDVRRHWGLHLKNRGEDPRPIYADALADYAKALELDPRCAELWRSRAAVRHALAVYGRMRGERVWDRLTEERADLDRALALEPASVMSRSLRAQLHMFWAECLILAGEEPAEACGQALADFAKMEKPPLPDRATLRVFWGEHERLRGRDASTLAQAARADLDAARAESAGSYIFWLAQGRLELLSALVAHDRREDPSPSVNAARAAYGKAIELNRDATEAHCQLGLVGRHEGSWIAERGGDPEATWERARADFDRALAITRIWEYVWFRRGELALARKLWADAVADFARVIEVNPGFVDALAAMGEAKRRWAEHEPARGLQSALADLDRAVDRGPNHPHARVERARVRLSLGDRAGARADLERALEVAPAWRERCADLVERAKER